MTWRQRGLDLKLGPYRLQIFSGFSDCDRWLVVKRNTIIWAWSAPRWLSVMRGDGRVRGGC